MKTRISKIAHWSSETLFKCLRPFCDEDKLKSWKPIHLCRWFAKNNLKIPMYFIGMAFAPLVSTVGTSNVGHASFDATGDITDTRNANPSRRGFCYYKGTSGDPTTSDSVVYEDDDYGTGEYTLTISGLDAESTYRVRAYAVNSEGPGYGTTLSVTTTEIPNDPPTIALNTADEHEFSENPPTLEFTGTDTDEDDLHYEVIADPSSDFNTGEARGTPDLYDSYSEDNRNGQYAAHTYDMVGQSFKVSEAGILDSCKFLINKTYPFNIAGEMVASLVTHDGTFGSDSTMSSPVLATSMPIDIEDIEYGQWTLIEFIFNENNRYEMEADTPYVILIDTSAITGMDGSMRNINIGADTAGDHPGNATARSRSTEAVGYNDSVDLCFYVYTYNAGTGPLITANTEDDEGLFENTVNALDIPPFNSGDKIAFTFPEALTHENWYYKVRAIDPAGSNEWSAWSAVRSFSVDSGAPAEPIAVPIDSLGQSQSLMNQGLVHILGLSINPAKQSQTIASQSVSLLIHVALNSLEQGQVLSSQNTLKLLSVSLNSLVQEQTITQANATRIFQQAISSLNQQQTIGQPSLSRNLSLNIDSLEQNQTISEIQTFLSFLVDIDKISQSQTISSLSIIRTIPIAIDLLSQAQTIANVDIKRILSLVLHSLKQDQTVGGADVRKILSVLLDSLEQGQTISSVDVKRILSILIDSAKQEQIISMPGIILILDVLIQGLSQDQLLSTMLIDAAYELIAVEIDNLSQSQSITHQKLKRVLLSRIQSVLQTQTVQETDLNVTRSVALDNVTQAQLLSSLKVFKVFGVLINSIQQDQAIESLEAKRIVGVGIDSLNQVQTMPEFQLRAEYFIQIHNLLQSQAVETVLFTEIEGLCIFFTLSPEEEIKIDFSPEDFCYFDFLPANCVSVNWLPPGQVSINFLPITQ